MTDKTVSIWMNADTIVAMNEEARIQDISKSKVVRYAVLRYADEKSVERKYKSDMKDMQSRKYD